MTTDTTSAREDYMEQYATEIAEYESLIAEAQEHYNRQDWNAGHACAGCIHQASK